MICHSSQDQPVFGGARNTTTVQPERKPRAPGAACALKAIGNQYLWHMKNRTSLSNTVNLLSDWPTFKY